MARELVFGGAEERNDVDVVGAEKVQVCTALRTAILDARPWPDIKGKQVNKQGLRLIGFGNIPA
jgi:hypothetical protein